MDKKFTRVPSDIFPTGVFELVVGFNRKFEKRTRVTNSVDALEFAKSFLYSEGSIEYAEKFFILLLDNSNQIYAYKLISAGGLRGTVVDPKLIFQTALLCHASAVILIHNHPSGNVKPSEADISLTKKIAEGGKILEIYILDHIIVSVEEHYSFADEGML